MAIERKYDKWIVQPEDAGDYAFEAAKKNIQVQVLSYDSHEEVPFYFEALIFHAGEETAFAIGDEITYPASSWIGKQQRRTGLRYFLYPHEHPFQETFHLMSLDPKDPGNLGGTMDVWVGEGENAELFSLNKPSILVLPEGVRHNPMIFKDMKRSFFFLLVAENKAYARASRWEEGSDHKYPPSIPEIIGDGADKWEPKPLTDWQRNKNEFGHLYKELDVKSFLRAPFSHRGRSTPIHHATWNTHHNIRKRVDCQLITGAGISFGCGDNRQFPPVPIKTSVWSTMSFFTTTPELGTNLNGKVEFWIGEGEDAEKYVFDKTTTVIIPPNTTYYPVHILECNKPFVMCSIIDEPLFAGRWIEKFPPEFKHRHDGGSEKEAVAS